MAALSNLADPVIPPDSSFIPSLEKVTVEQVATDMPPSFFPHQEQVAQSPSVDASLSILMPNLSEVVTPAALVSDPKFTWVAPPELVLNCAMESLMPSPGRFMESNCESPRFSLSEQFINGDSTVQSSAKPNLLEASESVEDPLAQSKVLEKTENASAILGKDISLPSTRAWKKPPTTSQPTTSTIPVLNLNSAPNWPTLDASNSSRSKRSQKALAVSSHLQGTEINGRAKSMSYKAATCSKDSTEDKSMDLRFPWAAKMDPSTRNLFKATSPIYLEDGTPKVQIPSHVFLHGLENQKEYVIGQFYRCSTPSGGLIHAVVNRIWGRNGRIFIRKLSDSSYLFHIPDETTRKWVIQRSLWHVDDCLMFVAPWTPTSSLELPVISTVPVWVTLKDIPHQLYSIPGISWIASGLGAPMATNKPRLDPFQMGEAKILVEVELAKQFPQKIALEDKNGEISMVQVEYAWIPSTCGRCGHLGHKEARCLQKCPLQQSSGSNLGETTSFNDYSVRNVDVPQARRVTASSDGLREPGEIVHVADTTSLPLPITGSSSVPNTAFLSKSDTILVTNRDEIQHPIADVVTTITPVTAVTNLDTFDNVSNTIDPAVSSINGKDSNTTLNALDFVSTSTEAIEKSALTTKDATLTCDLSASLPKTTTVSTVQGDVLDNNLFAALVSSDEENSEEDSFHGEDFMTASAQRILRDRPVKPSQKVQDMLQSQISGTRGKRGRGGQRRRGGRN